jgi:cysteine desulfurase
MNMSTNRYGRIYLDNAATTPVSEEVVQEMIPYLSTYYGNPSSPHTFGYESNRGVNIARKRVSALIGAKPSEIVFTGSGTEADNLAIKGAAYYARERFPKKNHIVTTTIEHDAVMESCKALEKNGFEVSYVPVNSEGLVNIARFEESISYEKTALISVMLANNETGTIQPIRELVTIARRKAENALFHTDGIQAIGKVSVNCYKLGVDLMAISSHKINGPKGVGGLFIRKGSQISSLISGGGQENHLRSGTENVHGIVGFGKACDLLMPRLHDIGARVRGIRDHLAERIISEIPSARYNGPSDTNCRLPNIAHFTFMGVNGEDLIIKLDEHGIAASTGSACSAIRQKESHVLRAMGFSSHEISGSLRLSLGPSNTIREVDQAAATLKLIVEELRKLSPYLNVESTRSKSL